MRRKITKILVTITLIVVTIVHINSTTWFRLKLTDYYVKRRDTAKLTTIYEKIIRKESVNPQYRRLNDNDYFDAHFALANLYFKERKLTKCLGILRKLNQIAPYYRNYPFYDTTQGSEDYKKAAICLLRAGFFDMALLEMKNYVGLDSADPLGRYQLGLMYMRKNNDNDAFDQFQKSIDEYGESSGAPRYISEAYFHMAEVLERKADPEKAIEYYKKAAQINDNNFRAYHRIIGLYRQLGREAEALDIEVKMGALKPYYLIDRRINDTILLGYYLDEAEFELFNDGEVVFIWTAPSGANTPERFNKIGNYVYEIRQVKNLAPDFGFEVDFLGTGSPCDWDSDYYNTSSDAHNIVIDSRDNSSTQCVMLDNLLENKTNCQSDYIELRSGYYLQCGLIRSDSVSGYFGIRWYTIGMKELPYDYVAVDVQSPIWKYYSRIFYVSPDIESCRVLLTNGRPGGKTYFDNIMLFKLELL